MSSREPEGRVLVRLPNWIGDAVMAAPALKALAATLPEVDLHLIGPARVMPLFHGFDEPFTAHQPLPKDRDRPDRLLRVARDLRRLKPDGALLLSPSFSAALLAWLAGAKLRVGWATDGRASLLNEIPEVPDRVRPLREQYLRLADALARRGFDRTLSTAPTDCVLPLRAEEIAWAGEEWARLELDPARTIALAPGATYGYTKRWPEERFLALASSLIEAGWSVVWVGGADEVESTVRLRDALDARGQQSEGLAGLHSLRQTLALLSKIRAVVSNDSGALHLAQAAGAPVVGIFGSTSPAWTGPSGAEARVVYERVACSPCFARSCPTQIECLTGLSVERVTRSVLELVDAARPAGKPALFLDRDGTLLELVSYLSKPEEVALPQGAGAALRAIQQLGYALVVITNQSILARGGLDRAGLRRVHRRLRELLRAESIELLEIEVCPHHPEFTGPCLCRKPEPGLLFRSAHRHRLDLGRSMLVGDSISDLEAGVRAGVKPMLIRSGYGRETEETLRRQGGRLFEREVEVVEDLTELAQRLSAASSGSGVHS